MAMGTGVITANITLAGDGFPHPFGDDFDDAIMLVENTGTGSLELLGATRQDGELANGYISDPDAGTVWLAYTPEAPGDITFTVTTDPGQILGLDAFEGDTLGELERVTGVGGGPALTVDFAVAQGIRYNFRVNPALVGSTPPVTYEYTYTERLPEFALTIADPEVLSTPATLRVSVTNGNPDTAVEFTVDDETALTWEDRLDESGVLVDVAIPLEEYPAGTHELTVTEALYGITRTTPFTIAHDPLPRPIPLAPDVAPILVPQVGVQRWVIQDPAPGGGNYTFPRNPAEMTSPFPAKSVTVETTVAADGQPLTFLGAAKPHPWEFRGWLDTQIHHDTLAAYAAGNRRYYLIDHRKRAWVVTFEHFDAQAQVKLNLPWAHEYTMRCLIHAGPEQL